MGAGGQSRKMVPDVQVGKALDLVPFPGGVAPAIGERPLDCL